MRDSSIGRGVMSNWLTLEPKETCVSGGALDHPYVRPVDFFPFLHIFHFSLSIPNHKMCLCVYAFVMFSNRFHLFTCLFVYFVYTVLFFLNENKTKTFVFPAPMRCAYFLLFFLERTVSFALLSSHIQTRKTKEQKSKYVSCIYIFIPRHCPWYPVIPILLCSSSVLSCLIFVLSAFYRCGTTLQYTITTENI